MLDVLRKLKGRSIEELRVRGKQAFSSRTERLGLTSDSRLPSDASLIRLIDPAKFEHSPKSSSDLLEHFRKRAQPRFFGAFDDPESTLASLKYEFETENGELIESADGIVSGRFDLLGFKNLNFGEPIDWHFEPVSGKRSPLLHWSRIDELDSTVTGDKKIVWELNRHQHFATLGRAYWLTKDEKYAETFASHLALWMDSNPPKIGLNWVSSLEVAFRAISWLWGLYFFKDSPRVQPDLYCRALKFLYLHARHLEMYLSTYSSPNTHLTGEALGLFYLGTVMPEFRDATRWREKGRRIMVDELKRHVLPDGVYFERATYYHRYTTDFYTHFLILSQRNESSVDKIVLKKLQALLDHLMYITRPDGTTPFIGDDDGGQLAKLDCRKVNDFRAALHTGAALFDRTDYRYVAGDVAEATLWLLGSEGMRKSKWLASHVPDSTSCSFPVGGCYVMRDGWTRDSNYLHFDCGPHGVYNCGHAHADALSFELAARGRTLLVDPGTYTYTGAPESRDYFRSSAAHNTLTIDGESSSVPDGPFSWKETANASIISWKTDARFDFLEGTHDGYERLKQGPATHSRGLLFLKQDYWVMRDSIDTDGSHRYEQHFHFAGGTEPWLEQDSVVLPVDSVTGESGLQIFSCSATGDWRLEDGWVSPCYGERAPAPVCTFSASGTGPQEFYTFLIPLRTSDSRSIVQEIEADGGHAFEIRDDKAHDVILFGNGGLVKTDRIATDFKWAWIRFLNGSETPEELVLIDGRSFTVDGLDIIRSDEHVDHLVAIRKGDKLLIKIGERVLEVVLSKI